MSKYNVAFSISQDKSSLFIYGIKEINFSQTFIEISNNGLFGYESAFSISIPTLRPFVNTDLSNMLKGFILNAQNISSKNISPVQYVNQILHKESVELVNTLAKKRSNYVDYVDYNSISHAKQYIVHFIDEITSETNYYVYTTIDVIENSPFIRLSKKTLVKNKNRKIFSALVNDYIPVLSPLSETYYSILTPKKGSKWNIINVPLNKIDVFTEAMDKISNVRSVLNGLETELDTIQIHNELLSAIYSKYNFISV